MLDEVGRLDLLELSGILKYGVLRHGTVFLVLLTLSQYLISLKSVEYDISAI